MCGGRLRCLALLAIPLLAAIPAIEVGAESAGSATIVLEPRPPAATEVRVVDIEGIQFLPDTLRIAAGETVEWRNGSKLGHTVTADPAKAANADHVRLPEGAEPFDSGDLLAEDTYRRTFDVPGTYTYFCVPHEMAGMVGTIVVTPAEPKAREGT